MSPSQVMADWIGNKKRWIAALLTTLTVGSSGALYGADQAQNPYIDKGDRYELPVRSDIPQGERVEIHKDIGKMDLIGWNDEYRISIEPQIPTANFGAVDRPFPGQANRPLLSNRLEYKSGNVTAFIQPKTENEFDIDFTLDAIPETNVFTYKITGAEDFDFFYQPELTPEEIADGASRPENVVGSYAVYHKTKANHRIGSTNYATGKVAHIYRPKAIDANGAEVWAELNYLDGVLSVTVPEKWLETVAYPVVVDPTFGYTTIGGTSNSQISTSAHWGLVGSQAYTASSGDTITKYSLYAACQAAGSVSFEVATYSVVTNTLTDKLDTASQITVNSTIPRWWDTSAISVALTAGTNYGVALGDFENCGGFGVLVYHDTGTGDQRDISSTSGASVSLATPWAHSSFDATIRSIYATYCVDGAECGPLTDYFTTPGYYEWTVPTGVTSAQIACWGAGGGGADGETNQGGGGGGGGAFASSTVSVSPSDTIRLYVAPSTAQEVSGEASTASTTAPTLLVSASGGTAPTAATGGAGGTSSTGDVTANGGAGGAATTGTGDESGGGGAAAGPHGAGGGGGNCNGAGATTGCGGGGGNGGTSGTDNTVTAGTGGTNGGNGGAGGNAGNGAVGSSGTFGGGGGGGGDDGMAGADGGYPGGGGGGGESGGGGGAAGQCQITYTISAGGGGGSSILNQYNVIWLD